MIFATFAVSLAGLLSTVASGKTSFRSQLATIPFEVENPWDVWAELGKVYPPGACTSLDELSKSSEDLVDGLFAVLKRFGLTVDKNGEAAIAKAGCKGGDIPVYVTDKAGMHLAGPHLCTARWEPCSSYTFCLASGTQLYHYMWLSVL